MHKDFLFRLVNNIRKETILILSKLYHKYISLSLLAILGVVLHQTDKLKHGLAAQQTTKLQHIRSLFDVETVPHCAQIFCLCFIEYSSLYLHDSISPQLFLLDDYFIIRKHNEFNITVTVNN